MVLEFSKEIFNFSQKEEIHSSNNKTYLDQLKDPRWQRKRLEIFQRDNWKCTECGNSTKSLAIHHLKYSGAPWEIDSEFLKTVCEDCLKNNEVTLCCPICKMEYICFGDPGVTYSKTGNDPMLYIPMHCENSHYFDFCLTLYEGTLSYSLMKTSKPEPEINKSSMDLDKVLDKINEESK